MKSNIQIYRSSPWACLMYLDDSLSLNSHLYDIRSRQKWADYRRDDSHGASCEGNLLKNAYAEKKGLLFMQSPEKSLIDYEHCPDRTHAHSSLPASLLCQTRRQPGGLQQLKKCPHQQGKTGCRFLPSHAVISACQSVQKHNSCASRCHRLLQAL